MLGACCAVAALAMTVAACGSYSDGPTGSSYAPQGTSTATYALSPDSPVNYIFPFIDGLSGFYSVYNVNDFQYLMYRPLYWFGKGTGPLLNEGLSLAYLPKYSGQTVTIKLKPNYRWSNGQPVDAQDVMFWMNMLFAERSIWAGYVQGYFPDNVKDVHAVGSNKIVMTIKGAYSETWFTDNELSQITPMPLAWDVTAAGKSNCAGGDLADCSAVWAYLNKQALDLGSYGTSKLWQVVDGPWHVQSVTRGGAATLLINKKYSGTLPAHHITKFELLPYTSEQAEFNVLQDPTGSQAIDVGYLPTVDAPPPSASGAGSNPDTMSNYRITTQYPWQLTYFPYNFDNTSGQAPIMRQLYFRQAFQDLVDQEGVIDGPLHGYGKPTIGPVSNVPVTKYLSQFLRTKGDQWPLNIDGAKAKLSARGWAMRGGVQTCVRAGSGGSDCGAGIRAGTQLRLNLIYATGTDWIESAVKELVSNALDAGIILTATPESFTNVTGTAFGGCAKGCSWDMAFWGSWTFAPDYLPTGEELFMNGAINNAGGYNNPTNNALTKATLHARTPSELYSAMATWQNYLADQLPVVWEPDAPTLIETMKGLHTGPMNSALDITPEDWYWQK
jgi:peptide/nickel transport system substrate-binding protein